MPKYAVVETSDWHSTMDPVPYCGSGNDFDSLCIGMPGDDKVIPRSQLTLNTRKVLSGCNHIGGDRQVTICDWKEE